jgi:predicted O-methyltransferase YrrM
MSMFGISRKMRQAASRWRNAFRRCGSYERLEGTDFHSGLGDSAWFLYGFVRAQKPSVCVEIGSAQGKSACYIGQALKENGAGRLYAIDPHCVTNWNDDSSIQTFDVIRRNIAAIGLTDQVEVVRATSEDAKREWKREIDFLFIDGDHSYAGIRRDFELFAPHVRRFGLVVFHDTLWDLNPDPRYSRADMGVPRFVEELRGQGYPVITLPQNFGVSLVQPTRGGVPLSGLPVPGHPATGAERS